MARKAKKYHFIYKTTNLLSGRYYIGMHSTNDLNDNYLGSGRRLRYSINKYGKENHKREILEFCKSRKELLKQEEEIVNLNEIAKVDCMNLIIGGGGGINGFDHISKKQHKLNSSKGGFGLKKRLQSDNEFRIKHRKIVSLNMLNAHKKGKINYNTFTGKIHTEETKKKMSESRKGTGIGINNSQYGTHWITNEKINKKIYKSDEIPKGFRLGRV